LTTDSQESWLLEEISIVFNLTLFKRNRRSNFLDLFLLLFFSCWLFLSSCGILSLSLGWGAALLVLVS